MRCPIIISSRGEASKNRNLGGFIELLNAAIDFAAQDILNRAEKE